MTTNTSNRRRAFADVVSIDAWHGDFGDKVRKVDLHADVVFDTARVGGEEESQIRFRLSLKKAEVIVTVPDHEPVAVDKGSVSRDNPVVTGVSTRTYEQEKTGRGKASLRGSLRKGVPSANLDLSLEGEARVATKKRIDVSEKITLMEVVQSVTGEGNYRWLVSAAGGGKLRGKPWDPVKKPRLKLVDKRTNRSKSLPPSVRVEVKCLREDLLIEDIEIKNGGIWGLTKGRLGFENRYAAAEAYIREALSKEGLEVKNISDDFGQLTLASTIAESS